MSVSFLRLKDVPRGPKDLVCRGSVRTAFMLSFVYLAAIVAIVVLPYSYGEGRSVFGWDPGGLFYVVLGFVVIIAMRQIARLIAALKDSNWLLHARPDGLYVKYRALLNHRHPEDDEFVAFIPRRNIAWVQGQSGTEPSKQGESCFLDIRLKDTKLSDFQERLKFERHRFMDAAKDTAMAHLPIHVIEPNVVRIKWTDAESRITPMLQETLKTLRAMAYAIAPRRRDETYGGDGEEQLLGLVERGEETAAISAAQQLYDVDATEARGFIERLRA